MFKFVVILAIFTANIGHSTYIKTEESTPLNLDDSETTAVPAISELSVPVSSEDASNLNPETQHILTGDLFVIRMTIKQEWSDDFLNRNSVKFQEFANKINMELISFFDNRLNIENSIARENFNLKSVLPSIEDGYVYVTLVAETTERVTGQTIFEKLDAQLSIYSNIYELGIKSDGFEVKEISYSDLKTLDGKMECENEFCKQIEHQPPQIVASDDQCSPDEKIHRGSTSIYIFENNQKCIENIKNPSMESKCNKIKREYDENKTSEKDDLDTSPSEVYPRIDESTKTVEEEVIVVVRKRGDKVFIEI